MRVLMTGTADRSEFHEYYRQHIPGVEIFDDSLLSTLDASNEGYLHMEDHVILTKHFYEKVKHLVGTGQRPIQFLPTVNEGHFQSGQHLTAGCCLWIPQGHSRPLSEFLALYSRETGIDHWDTAVGRFWMALRIPIWNVHNAMVQRTVGKKARTFTNPEYQYWPEEAAA